MTPEQRFDIIYSGKMISFVITVKKKAINGQEEIQED